MIPEIIPEPPVPEPAVPDPSPPAAPLVRARRKPARRPLPAKLIFNASSGRPEESAQQLADILAAMWQHQIVPEVFTVQPNSRVGAVVQNAIRRGIKLIVVAGGDGTVDSVAGTMVGSGATLGIIPTGTRNNVALSLGISKNIPEAVALLRDGRRLRIDVGQARLGRTSRWFIEGATLGLLSDLYPVADDIQHGKLAQIGELLSTFIAAAPSRLRLSLGGRERLDTTAHMVLVANMPYLGPNFQIAPSVSFEDGLLDVFVFSDMGKLDLIGYVMQSGAGRAPDARIKHYKVKQVAIEADPPMAIVADGDVCGAGHISALIRPRALQVMAGAATPVVEPAAPAVEPAAPAVEPAAPAVEPAAPAVEPAALPPAAEASPPAAPAT